MTAVSSSTTAPSKAPSVYHPQPEKCVLCRLRGGAEHCAVIASVIETCKLNDVDPLA
jgi:hypothetical protein